MLATLDSLSDHLPPGTRLLGLDVGDKTVGLAVSDPGLLVASPIHTIRRGRIDQDAKELAQIVAERDVGAMVVGLPLNMDGSSGPRVQSVRAFVRNLDQRGALFDRPLVFVFWDERLSTAAVQRFMTDEADMTRKRRGQVVDKMAAAFILQGALDALAFRRDQVAPTGE